MDYHLMYNDLMDKTNAIFVDAENVRSRVHKMIGYSPMQIIEKADEREMLVREINKKNLILVRHLQKAQYIKTLSERLPGLRTCSAQEA